MGFNKNQRSHGCYKPLKGDMQWPPYIHFGIKIMTNSDDDVTEYTSLGGKKQFVSIELTQNSRSVQVGMIVNYYTACLLLMDQLLDLGCLLTSLWILSSNSIIFDRI